MHPVRRALVASLSLALVAGVPPALAEPPARARSVMSHGLQLRYEVSGHGAPVVLLSGGPGFDAEYMKPIGALLAKEHTVVVLRQRGTTGSLPTVLDQSTVNEDLLMADLEALRKALGYEQWAVLGHSFGTYTAMRYAIAYPSRVSRLVLLATVAPKASDDNLDANIAKRLSPQSLARLGEIDAKWTSATPRERDDLILESAKTILPAYLHDQRHLGEVLAGMPPGSIHGDTADLLNRERGQDDLTASLARLKLPVLIIQGRSDPLDPSVASKTRDAIPGAKLLILESSGHFAWIEEPRRLQEAMVAFLKD